MKSAAVAVSVQNEASALDYCRRLTRRRARNFYYGLRLSPEPERSALYAIYAWMRRADDLVDAAPAPTTESAQAQADHLRAVVEDFRFATVHALNGGAVDDDPLWSALASVGRRFDLPGHCFHAVLDGQLDDLKHPHYESFEDLRAYCYRVASAVGLLCIAVWGYQDQKAEELAISRGIAFQLTNILRDYRQDFDNGRVYLPRDDFDAHRLSPEWLRQWKDATACEAFLRFQIARAERFYSESAGLESLISPHCVPTLQAMTEIYHGLLGKMRTDPAALILRRRVRLSAWQKAAIALRARWRASSTR